MNRQEQGNEIRNQARQLLDGPLKHARAAALAAALLPLASVAATPAAAQDGGSWSGGCVGAIGDVVWHDSNKNGVQDPGEPGIAGAVVTVSAYPDSPVATDETGVYMFYGLCAGTHKVAVQIPPGMQVSPANQGGDDSFDSDGVADGFGSSVAEVTLQIDFASETTIDFGFWTPPVQQPGTGTPGYWKNHPEAWPVASITVGGVTYTKEQAIAWLSATGGDKTITMFSSLVPAKLNVIIGNDSSCVASTIESADAWMAQYGPVGRKVHAASLAWKVGEPHHRAMDNYNNGMLCAPHRD